MNLFETAAHTTEDEFQKEALMWLDRRIGFDGVIWGSGTRQETGALAIDNFLLSGRPQGLVLDYPISAHADPVSSNFLRSPTTLQNASTHRDYRPDIHSQIREYLDYYRVRQLLLCGVISPDQSVYRWIVCYREDERRAFSPALDSVARNAISMTLYAEQFHRSAQSQTALENSINLHPNKTPSLENLTSRQLQVLGYLEQGWSNKLIARSLEISENTLKCHMRMLFRALDVNSRSQALIAGRAIREHMNKTTDHATQLLR